MRDTGPRTTITTNGLASIGHGSDALLIRSRDAARMLNVSERTLFAMTAPRGPIVPVRIGRADSHNPRVLYSVERLREWIAAETVRPQITHSETEQAATTNCGMSSVSTPAVIGERQAAIVSEEDLPYKSAVMSPLVVEDTHND